MKKSIDTLIKDIYSVVEGDGGWDKSITKFFSENLSLLAERRLTKKEALRDYLSPSMLGSKCDREKWYRVNEPDKAEPLTGKELGKFFYGDMLEIFLVSLIKAAGHKVDGLQESVDVFGISGSLDIVVDGMLVDIKTASRFGFTKFENHQLKGYTNNKDVYVLPEDADPFGYISQISSYLAGCQDKDFVTEKNKAGFLVVNKESFDLTLDIYDLSEEIKGKEAEVQRNIDMVEGPLPEERLPVVKDGASGNYKLGVKCSYCGFKNHCWPNLRLFVYSNGPRWLTHVAREPNVPEVKNE